MAHADRQKSGTARLTLARFYLANGYAAEALGLLNLLQAHDPALAGDAQLVTMRAAAEYMMGRNRDAHNDLAGPGFDSDRHAAFWRGLIEAKAEDWKNAHAHLEQAGPVMSRYPTAWQARATIADAEAALGLGRLDLADAALHRMPKELTPQTGAGRRTGAGAAARRPKPLSPPPPSISSQWKRAATKGWRHKRSSITPSRP